MGLAVRDAEDALVDEASLRGPHGMQHLGGGRTRPRHDVERRVEPPHVQPEFLRFYASDLIERLTGARVFEFRNYTVV